MGKAPTVTLTERDPPVALRHDHASEWVLSIKIPGEPKPTDELTGTLLVGDHVPRRLALAAILKSAWSELLHGKGSPVDPEYPGFKLLERSPPERRAYFEGYQAAMKCAEEVVRSDAVGGDGHRGTVDESLYNLAEYLKRHAERMRLTSEAMEP